MASDPSAACPCDSGDQYDHCCGPILRGERDANTARALMRSRYTAFVEHNRDYLLRSWHPRTRPERLDFDPQQRWLGLKIKQFDAGGAEDESGSVEFVARYKIGGRGHRLHEISRFERLAGAWVYVSGTLISRPIS